MFREQPFYSLMCFRRGRKFLIIILVLLVILLVYLRFTYKNSLVKVNHPKNSVNLDVFREVKQDCSTDDNCFNSVDVHVNGNLDVHHVHNSDPSLTSIAIGLALTSKGVYNVTESTVRYKFEFFRSFLPSFCKTSTQGYIYHFYVAYDQNDPYFTNAESFSWFSKTFATLRRDVCSYVSEMELHLIQCSHSHRPAWAQNDAMMEAYLDHRDYYYRLNDDSLMKSPGWTETYINRLRAFTPPNVGVVGPGDTRDKVSILTFDFVHRTHIDIFGLYYPRLFTDWFADDWMTSVYQPNRSEKVYQVKVRHTQLLGTRYSNQFSSVQYLHQQLLQDKRQIDSHINSLGKSSSREKKKSRKGILIVLNDLHVDTIYGLIRNIHLAKRLFWDWKVFIIATHTVPQRILVKLNEGNLRILTEHSKYETSSYPFLAAYLEAFSLVNTSNLEYFVIRHALSRLSERDVDIMKDWEISNAPFYCVRDHPYHNAPLIPGLFGAKADAYVEAFSDLTSTDIDILMRNVSVLEISSTAKQLRTNHTFQYAAEKQFLNGLIWPRIKANCACYDSVHCESETEYGMLRNFPKKRENIEFVGEYFKANEVAMDYNASAVLLNRQKKC